MLIHQYHTFYIYTVTQKGATLSMTITLPVLDRFAKLFHYSKEARAIHFQQNAYYLLIVTQSTLVQMLDILCSTINRLSKLTWLCYKFITSCSSERILQIHQDWQGYSQG